MKRWNAIMAEEQRERLVRLINEIVQDLDCTQCKHWGSAATDEPCCHCVGSAHDTVGLHWRRDLVPRRHHEHHR